MEKTESRSQAPLPTQLDFITRWRGRVRLRSRLRHWWRGVDPRRAGLPRVLANGIPKAGTHLLVRCLELLPGMVWENLGLQERRLIRRLGEVEQAVGVATVLVGVESPKFVQAAGVRKLLKQLRPGEFSNGHMPYSRAFVELLEELGWRTLLIVRDPRDIAVSSVYHMLSRPQAPGHEYVTQMLKTNDERLLAWIAGIPIPKRLDPFLSWLDVPLNYTTRFERLVGEQGGGSEESQRQEIENIARHLGLSPSSAQLDFVVANLFGKSSPTFRRGQIGSWREHFKEEHKQAFKEVAGQVLIDLGYEKSLDW